jgi:hypothetical protein
MAQFLFKFLDYIASDIIVKRLANSKTFQRFALQGRADHGDCVQEGRGGGGQPALDKTKNTEDGELKDKQIHEGIRG